MTHRIIEEIEDNSSELEEQEKIHVTLLECVEDVNSCMFKLRGTPHIVDKIWQMYRAPYYWKSLIKLPPDVGRLKGHQPKNVKLGREVAIETEFLKEICTVEFPPPKNININMMPFIYHYQFDETLLPEYLREYFETMLSQMEIWENLIETEFEKVCYLSIQESQVSAQTSHRRPGLHTENPGKMDLPTQDIINKGDGSSQRVWYEHDWGNGMIFDHSDIHGGIYMASNVHSSCKVRNCKIMPDSNGDEIIGNLGNIEHLRGFLPEGECMKANTMYWISDRTPHESLPLPKSTYRQWFRLVTSQVSLWFEDHSTKNPNGVVPDPTITKIIKGSKFRKETLQVVTPDYTEETLKQLFDMSLNAELPLSNVDDVYFK